MARTYRLGPARKTLNAGMRTLLRIGEGGRSTYLLTTTGRTSGRLRTTPVTLVEGDGDRWLVSPYGAVAWVYNVRAHPEVILRRGGSTHMLHADEVGPQIAGPVLKRYLGQVRVTAPFFDVPADAAEAAFVAEADRHPVFRLTGLETAHLPPG
jgi:deazaflavin-dependent oxidoreductase (nitroreductase family)